MNLPYTYLIGWKHLNKWYYGVRYAKNCHPDELMKTYFTSSKYVLGFRKKHGNPDIIQIRKIFTKAKAAINWEQRVLRRMNVEEDSKFLNSKNSTTQTIISGPNRGSFTKNHIPWNKNKKYDITKEERKKFGREFSLLDRKILSEKQKERFKDTVQKTNLSLKTKQYFQNKENKEKHRQSCVSFSDRVWINDGNINKRVPLSDLNKFDNWNRGRLIPSETKTKMMESRKFLKQKKVNII